MPAELQAAGTILRRRTPKGDRWLLLQSSKHGEWGFPKGHLDPGETLAQAALRETVEECGIALFAVTAQPYEMHYRLPTGRHKMVAYFPAITAQERVALSSEHTAAEWCSVNTVTKRLPHAQLLTMFASYLKALQ
ncbi:MAG: NUDIX domain-containing protein [Planctomycetota bacterium]|jgi:8-oxo-dGTP pyrophosphatase MutT (NUDIX family)|nr:NUDIX domain-containing protein [Planctomycetota bacterium]